MDKQHVSRRTGRQAFFPALLPHLNGTEDVNDVIHFVNGNSHDDQTLCEIVYNYVNRTTLSDLFSNATLND